MKCGTGEVGFANPGSTEVGIPEIRAKEVRPVQVRFFKLSTYLAAETRPDAAAVQNQVHVVWHEERNSNDEIMYMQSLDSMTSWEAEQ